MLRQWRIVQSLEIEIDQRFDLLTFVEFDTVQPFRPGYAVEEERLFQYAFDLTSNSRAVRSGCSNPFAMIRGAVPGTNFAPR